MDDSLLPSNATPLERALEIVLRDCVGTLASASSLISTCKENPKDDWLLWLIWEYGLEELLPYIPDLRQLIIEGIPWQRIRGTPASVKQALRWIGSNSSAASSVEEEETNSVHWHEFMIDPGFVPNGTSETKQIVDIAKLAAPTGMKLARIFHGYDIRRFKPDYSDWGDLLSDYSGYKDPELGVVLSFGRFLSSIASVEDDGESEAVFSHSRLHDVITLYEDRPLLDFSPVFGEVPQRVYESTVYQYVSIFGGTLLNDPWRDEPWQNIRWFDYGTPVFGGQLPEKQTAAITRVLPRAAVVLSDSEPLGDTNAVLMFREWSELGGAIDLSSGDRISDKPWAFKYLPVDERFEHVSASAIEYNSDIVLIDSVHIRLHDTTTDRVLQEQKYWQDLPWVNEVWADYQQAVAAKIYSASVVERERTSFTQSFIQSWQPITWGVDSWRETEIIVRTNHYGDSA